jgi:hypothetical protein
MNLKLRAIFMVGADVDRFGEHEAEGSPFLNGTCRDDDGLAVWVSSSTRLVDGLVEGLRARMKQPARRVLLRLERHSRHAI